ncbi:hypothetical protein Zmor_023686 [Zophobas morio]|uniref:CHK kinase-like domain-containing protein n=1 Tax=Zophobas morio TaxID=2755281 RepID=A0AA38HXL8_9CUCU|nr:hypothetical protein Zmor_023686 [Zophobas morio]
MERKTDRGSEVQNWLKVALAQENLKRFSIEIIGNSEKGDGFVGDIIFVCVTGTDKEGKNKEYNLVLKCSKSSAALMENAPAFRTAFVREAYIYENVFPFFKQFQFNKGIEKPFDSVPKCYGVYSDQFRHVIVLENLKKLGYDLWPKAKPLTRGVIDTIIREYAKFHAISVAVEDQFPERFQKLLQDSTENTLKEFMDKSGFLNVFKNSVEEVYDLLRDDVKNETLEEWLKLKDQVGLIFGDMTPSVGDLKVINHGDCWMNNFLYKFEDEEKNHVSKFAILDWQLSKFTSPATDLSYFLFSSISKEDITDIDTILKDYYRYFCEYLRSLDTKVSDEYTMEKFFSEWKKYGRYGAVFCIIPIKSLYSEKEHLPDVAEAANRGEDIIESFKFELKDESGFKNRLRPIVEYVVKNII